MNINTLVPLAVVFVVAAFTLSIGSTIMDDAAKTFCDGTYFTTASPATNSPTANPVTGGYWGCCDTLGTGASNCTAWNTQGSMNATFYGSDSLNTTATWLPTLALVIIAAVIIGILITYLARGASSV